MVSLLRARGGTPLRKFSKVMPFGSRLLKYCEVISVGENESTPRASGPELPMS